jgi:hypothetical protein
MGGAVEQVGDFIQDEIIDPVKEVGRDIDDFVNEEIPGGWYTVGAAAGGAYLANAGAAGAGTAGTAGTAAPIVDATYAAGMTPTPGLTATLPTTGSLGATTALGATSSAVPGSLQAFLPDLGVSTAATTAGATAIPGSFQAALPGILSPAAASFGVKDAIDALRMGNSIRGMLGQPEPQIPNMLGRNQAPQGSVDYSAYLNLLAQRPRRADITSLLG